VRAIQGRRSLPLGEPDLLGVREMHVASVFEDLLRGGMDEPWRWVVLLKGQSAEGRREKGSLCPAWESWSSVTLHVMSPTNPLESSESGGTGRRHSPRCPTEPVVVEAKSPTQAAY
jgi:hypothetical protein